MEVDGLKSNEKYERFNVNSLSMKWMHVNVAFKPSMKPQTVNSMENSSTPNDTITIVFKPPVLEQEPVLEQGPVLEQELVLEQEQELVLELVLEQELPVLVYS
jgi:hypothetical protein